MCFVLSIPVEPEWIQGVHQDSGMSDKTYLAIQTMCQVMDPTHNLPDMMLPLVLMIQNGGIQGLVSMLSQFLAHNPPPPSISIPGRN